MNSILINPTIQFKQDLLEDNGPGDEPSYAGSNRGRIRGRKIERPLIEVTPGQRSIEGISPLAKRGLIEVTLFFGLESTLPSSEIHYKTRVRKSRFHEQESKQGMSPVKSDLY